MSKPEKCAENKKSERKSVIKKKRRTQEEKERSRVEVKNKLHNRDKKQLKVIDRYMRNKLPTIYV